MLLTVYHLVDERYIGDLGYDHVRKQILAKTRLKILPVLTRESLLHILLN
jgi:hypothetical protein